MYAASSDSAGRRIRMFVALLALLCGGFVISTLLLLFWRYIPYNDSLIPILWLFSPLALLTWFAAFAIVGAALYLNTGISPLAVIASWIPGRVWRRASSTPEPAMSSGPEEESSRDSSATLPSATSSETAVSTSALTAESDTLKAAPVGRDGPSPAAAQVANTLTRLRSEVEALGRRANVNLLLGIAITATGMTALFVYVWYQPSITDSMTWVKVGGYFIPRLSLVILIEVFAYFFLQLYKSDLQDMKYYQNELTNFESKILALSVASETRDKKAANVALLTLASTERNFVLKKGETTVDLERAKADRSQVTPAIAGAIQLLLDAATQKPAKPSSATHP